jgi:hypothetical protein
MVIGKLHPDYRSPHSKLRVPKTSREWGILPSRPTSASTFFLCAFLFLADTLV